MMAKRNQFKRGVSQAFIEALNEKYREGGWWKQIVTDRKLFIGFRGTTLNVYSNGASLLELRYRNRQFTGKTHFKYLRRDLPGDEYVKFNDGKFIPADWEPLYENLGGNLEQIKKATGKHQGDEKKGVHQICLCNDNVIDVEIAVPGEGARMDFAALRDEGAGPKLVFYEAKILENLNVEKAVEQVESYEKILTEREGQVKESYLRVCSNIRALEGYPRNSLVDQDFEVSPEVRLVVFKFNDSQRKAANAPGGIFDVLRNRLGTSRVITRGRPKGLRVGVSL